METTTEKPAGLRQIAVETELELRRARLAAELMGKPLLAYVLDMALQEIDEAREASAAPKRPTDR